MNASAKNIVIVKVQSYLVSEVYKEENQAVAIIVSNINRALDNKSYSEIKYIAMTKTAKEIVNEYC